MQPAVRIVVSLVFLTSALAVYHSSTKLRRDGVLHLYPFPRVGRASRNTWQLPIVTDYKPIERRQLYPFPRVGRSELSREPLDGELRVRRMDSTGMWFGPRIGRAFKRDDDGLYRSDQTLRDPLQLAASDNSGMWFGPRVGRSFKNEDEDITTQNENLDRSEPEQMELVQVERKKRQAKLM